jgi:hypothetical protein
MSFAGWALADLALLFAGGGVAITGLYLLRMRRRQVVVPFAALWERVSRETETRKLWRRLRRLLSWLLQLMVLALVCLALGDPRPDVWLRDPVTVAIVIDRSASMAGAAGEEDEEDPGSRLEAAVGRARAELGALGPADQAVVITAGTEIGVAAPLGRDPSSQIAALEEITVQPGEADLRRAIALARNALGGHPNPKILVLTDGALGQSGLDAVADCIAREDQECVVSVTTGNDQNVAITAFAARRYPGSRDKVEVLVEVHNLGREPASVLLDVEADGLSVGKTQMELQPDERKREVLANLDAARTQLVARLEPGETDDTGGTVLGPGEDDLAYAVIPPLKPIAVTLVTDGENLFLEAALIALDDHVRLSGISPEEGTADNPFIEESDLVFYDVGAANLPNPLPDKHLVVFDPHRHDDSAFPIALAKQLVRPRLTEQVRKHPILSNVVFKDINMHRGTSFSLMPGDQALVKHLGDPIVVLREEAERSILGLGFDPRQSDLPLRVAFPLLIANTVDYFEHRIAGFVAALPIGSDRELGLAELGLGVTGVTAVEVTAPDSDRPARVRVQNGRFRMRALVPGIHSIKTLDGEGAGASVELAVNQASSEASNLKSKLDELPPSASAGDAPDPAPLSEGPLWTLILLIIAGVFALEWASYHRRKTV